MKAFMTYFAALIILLVPSALLAQATIGAPAPHSLTFKDQNGEERSFDSYRGEKGLVMVFVRSADWCPYCQVQMLELRGADGKRITDMGFSIATVSYDAPEKLKAFADKYSFEHVMLSDEGSEAIKAFGILNEDYNPDHFAYGVPHPHVYVIGNDKTVRAILSEEGYKKRPQVEAIVETIEGLR